MKIFVTAFEEVEDFNIDMDFILKKVHVFIDQICKHTHFLFKNSLRNIAILGDFKFLIENSFCCSVDNCNYNRQYLRI